MTDIAGKWLRVSTSGQDEANQEPDIDGWISGHSYGVGPTYQLHGKSASKGEQDKELDKVVKDMKAGVINVLVVWHSSRIERRGAESVFDLARRVREAGGRIEYVQDSHLNETNDLSDVMLALAASQNKQYSRNISKQTIAGFDRIDGNGAIRNRAGYGHRIVKVKKYHNRFELNDAEAEIIRLAVSRYLSGQSLEHICRWLTSTGHRGRNGAAFTPKTLGKILRSETLIGRYHQGDVVAKVPAIITVKEHNAILAKLDAKAYRKGVRTRPDTALLTSILYCGKCGRPMYRFASRGNNPVVYYCRPKDGVSCKMMVPLAETDQEVIEGIGLAIYLAHRTQEVVIPGHDYADDIEQVKIDIRELASDAGQPDWIERMTAMNAEIARLAQLPPEPDVVKTVAVDTVAEANAWQRLPMAEKRQRLLDTGVKMYATKDADGNISINQGGRKAA